MVKRALRSAITRIADLAQSAAGLLAITACFLPSRSPTRQVTSLFDDMGTSWVAMMTGDYHDDTRQKRGAREGHQLQCLCDQCVQQFSKHYRYCDCDFCHDHRYAMSRVEWAERHGEVKTLSAINICERCETMALGKAMGIVTTRLSPDDSYRTVEICPGCVEELCLWLQAGELITRDVKAYKNPYTPPAEGDEQTDRIQQLLDVAGQLIERTKAIES